MAEKIVQTAGRDQLGEFAPAFAHYNDDVLFGENWLRADKEKSRWRDPTWFAWLCAVAYMLPLKYLGVGLIYHVGLFANMPFFINGIYDGNVMGLEMLVVGCIVFALWLWLAKVGAMIINIP